MKPKRKPAQRVGAFLTPEEMTGKPREPLTDRIVNALPLLSEDERYRLCGRLIRKGIDWIAPPEGMPREFYDGIDNLDPKKKPPSESWDSFLRPALLEAENYEPPERFAWAVIYALHGQPHQVAYEIGEEIFHSPAMDYNHYMKRLKGFALEALRDAAKASLDDAMRLSDARSLPLLEGDDPREVTMATVWRADLVKDMGRVLYDQLSEEQKTIHSLLETQLQEQTDAKYWIYTVGRNFLLWWKYTREKMPVLPHQISGYITPKEMTQGGGAYSQPYEILEHFLSIKYRHRLCGKIVEMLFVTLPHVTSRLLRDAGEVRNGVHLLLTADAADWNKILNPAFHALGDYGARQDEEGEEGYETFFRLAVTAALSGHPSMVLYWGEAAIENAPPQAISQNAETRFLPIRFRRESILLAEEYAKLSLDEAIATEARLGLPPLTQEADESDREFTAATIHRADAAHFLELAFREPLSEYKEQKYNELQAALQEDTSLAFWRKHWSDPDPSRRIERQGRVGAKKRSPQRVGSTGIEMFRRGRHTDVTVFQNPNRKEIAEMGDSIRFILDKKNAYLWNAHDAIHSEVMSHLMSVHPRQIFRPWIEGEIHVKGKGLIVVPATYTMPFDATKTEADTRAYVSSVLDNHPWLTRKQWKLFLRTYDDPYSFWTFPEE